MGNLDLGTRFRELRKNKRLTQRKFAEHVNISPSTVAMIERGERNLTAETAKVFSSFFNVSSDYLLGISDNPLPSYDINPNDLQVALYGEIKDLSKDDIDDILNYARYIKEKRAKKIINLEK